MMNAEEHNLRLIDMPELVLEKILCNIHNPSNVSRTCKYLYKMVCFMEKHRRAIYISASDAKSRLNIDTDAVFNSIMNSHRPIKEMELRLDKVAPSFELNERQLVRMVAIMKRFSANVTSLRLYGSVPINFILELLQQATKLESLSFTYGKVIGSVNGNATMSLQLPNLKALKIIRFPGVLDIVNLIPAGSLNSITCVEESTETVTIILTKQHNTKFLTIEVHSDSDLTALCDYLQLETLTFMTYAKLDYDIPFVEFLKCHTNLKELRLINCNYNLSGSSFQWICNNLKKLEVFEVYRLDSSSIERNACELLCKLKQLRHFRTYYGDYLFDNGFQSFQFKSNSIEKFEFGYWPEFSCAELLNKMVNSMASNLPNLTHLKMRFENFSAIGLVLGHCTKIVHLSCFIKNPIPAHLTQQSFPSVQHLELCNYPSYAEQMSQSMPSIVRAMSNLKSMSLLIRSGLKFDVKTMKEFVKESRSLEYFYVDHFELERELSIDDAVETIGCLVAQLKGYHINLIPSISAVDLNWHKMKDILSNEFYVRADCWNLRCFYLQKGGMKRSSDVCF